MSVYSRNMWESITYWPPLGNDGYGGVLHGDPQIIKARWQSVSQLFRDEQAREVMSEAVVYVNADVEIRGKLFRGVVSDGGPPDGALEIRKRDKSPSLRQTQTLHKVYL